MSSHRLRNLFTSPPRPTLVAASILSADFANLGQESLRVLSAGADLLHLDVMDGHFVPNLTMGPALCRSLRDALPAAFLDVHLMVTDPAMFVDRFAEAGANHVSFHIEAEADPVGLATCIHAAGMTAGLALNPKTPHWAAAPFLGHVDVLLIMSVNPGFSGQRFMPQVLDKARAARPALRPDQRVEIDGGVNSETAPLCINAGCDVLVAASAIFERDDYDRAVAELRGELPSRSPALETRR